ncbi:MAG: sulfate reduction electron transfer complex DsrMKJOP subunit DsrJ [Dissulfurimicrobium sp.]|uniref:sulfate reduction electron transfer complex DsrMKJOP subunit DsrJ n=1 Tax=Dissulfurimicrobium TaxID=1769732 RepID=UPI001EDA705E|nr:sulfate reduction electron transfer complex DsrMKJOP subunit DsrJ [Dissulfurimicrobium hydrothermale]UKL13882.1 sulfate reduction electron transfer complex DsrMKJOP subunit DsrJ [Dissulfurimicrobium hydrothermale]
MYDANKIIPGLVIFVGLMTVPIWSAMGRVVPPPKPKLDTPVIRELAEKKCVEGKEFMKSSHMQFLITWRDEALRKGKRVYINSRGQKYYVSLQNTCMKCHSNKKEFCDRCHNYAGVEDPYCWECHLAPRDAKGNEL